MFIDESAFDEIDEIKVTSKFSSRPSTAVTAPNSKSNTLNLDEFEQDDDLPAFRSAGTLNTPSSSRARMLAQQRELQMKKRQSQMQNSGMVRSSVESSNSPVKNDGQFTPAARQFSAPKAVKDPALNESSEFIRPSSARPPSSSASRGFQAPRRNRYSDEEDEDDDNAGYRKGNSPKPKSRNDDDYNQQRKSTGRNGGNRGGYDDDRDYDRRSQRDDVRGSAQRQKSSRRDYDDDEEGTDVRRSGTSNGRSSKNNEQRSSRQYDDDEDNGGNRWANKTAGANDPRNSYNNSNFRPNLASSSSNINSPTHQDSAINNSSNSPAPSRPITIPPDLTNMRKFLTTPVPKQCGVVQCYIRRNKSGTHKLYPVYSLYLKDGDVFLLTSKKRPNNKTSNYLISMDQSDLNRSSSSYLGKLRSNFVGTEFQIFDDGVNPKDNDGDDEAGMKFGSNVRCELGSVMYAANVLGSRGPRKMQVAVPAVDENGNILKWKDGAGPNGPGDDMLTRMKERNFRDLMYLINKPPRWNEQVGAYVLNFNGRVTMASVKNFQLVDPEEQNTVVLQFGRVGKDEFTMDLQYPMSPFQAFALTLSSFDSKIACD